METHERAGRGHKWQQRVKIALERDKRDGRARGSAALRRQAPERLQLTRQSVGAIPFALGGIPFALGGIRRGEQLGGACGQLVLYSSRLLLLHTAGRIGKRPIRRAPRRAHVVTAMECPCGAGVVRCMHGVRVHCGACACTLARVAWAVERRRRAARGLLGCCWRAPDVGCQ